MCQFVDVLVSQLLAVHLLDAVRQQAAVQTDEVRLGQLAYQRGNVLVLHIGVGVILGARCGIHRLHVLRQERHLLQRLAVLGVLLAIEDERLGHPVEAFAHQCLFHLVLYVFHLDVVVHVQMAQDFRDSPQVSRLVHALERLYYGVHDFV